MRKDLKAGIFIGLAVVVSIIVVMSMSTSWRLTGQHEPSAQTHKPAATPATPGAPSEYPTRRTLRIPKVIPQDQEPSVEDSDTTELQEEVSSPKAARYHVVREGETLSYIAEQYYGSSRYWEQIQRANESLIREGHTIVPGMKLVIPDLDLN